MYSEAGPVSSCRELEWVVHGAGRTSAPADHPCGARSACSLPVSSPGKCRLSANKGEISVTFP